MPALDDDFAPDHFVPPIPVTIILDIGGSAGSPRGLRNADLYASVAIQVDDFSLMMVAYDDSNSNFVGIVSTVCISNDCRDRCIFLVIRSYCY